MAKRVLIAVVLWLSATPVFAQAVVGQPVTFAFDTTTPATQPAGRSVAYRFYVDGVPNDQVVFGNPINGVITFVHPPFTAAGSKTARVSVKYIITDSTKFRCTGTPLSTVPEIDCTEQTSDPLAFIVSAPTTPPPSKPTNLRIIITPELGPSGNEVGATLALYADDVLVVEQFVPVARRRTGQFLNAMTLVPPSIIQR